MKIAIEGMDGTGKTTLAKKMAQKYNMEYVSNPIKTIFNLKQGTKEYEYMDEQEIKIYKSDNKILRAWLTGMGNMYALMQKGDYVLDRSYVSNYFWVGNEKTEDIFKLMIKLVGVPDMIVLLKAAKGTRIQRIKKRNINDKDLKDMDAMKLGYDKMLYFIKKFNMPYIVIDTENKNIEEVMEYTEMMLKKKNIKLIPRT